MIFIPESGKMLHKIADLIADANKDERAFQLVGTNQWEDITTLNNKNLHGAWFAAPDHKRFAVFERNYYQLYQKFPPRIATIAYDSIAAIAELVDRNSAKPLKVSDFVNYTGDGKNGFVGIDDRFRFLDNGLTQRNLSVIRVGNGDFETIDEAGDAFLKYNYEEGFDD
ncbi:MAG TPA: hypothetical protein VI861_03085 [Rickettsiales bacterium]|nr:hypothetical protein [Rickettsiales bacterium]